MYQSFTGSSRRPRQVNLSGRTANPFAAVGGPQTAVQNAQQDRQQRQKQREELEAARTVQRVWRGHRARRTSRASWRQQWDAVEANTFDPVRRLNMLLLFFSPANPDDVARLARLVSRQPQLASDPRHALRLEKACLAALSLSHPASLDILLELLASLASTLSQIPSWDCIAYYHTLAKLQQAPTAKLPFALVAPLTSPSLNSYTGFANAFLSTPIETTTLDNLSPSLDLNLLTDAVSAVSLNTNLNSTCRLWLLGQYIYLMKGGLSVSRSLPAIARLLSPLADQIAPDDAALDMTNKVYDENVLASKSSRVPLNSFLKQQLVHLVDQTAIRSLVSHPPSSSNASVLDESSETVHLLAGYALTLVRLFPSQADNIRMWLYLGSPSQSSQVHTTSAVTYFWKGMRATTTYAAILRDPRSAVDLLKAPMASVSSWQPPASIDHSARQKLEWRVILVFLELFTFVVKVLDDEEFFGASSSQNSSNALSIPDLHDLTVFLKNLGFTMYFNSEEISATFQPRNESLSAANLSRHLGQSTATVSSEAKIAPVSPTIAGGISLDYVKGLVTVLLRSLYERDSRRNFLPENHWLMTSQFDMTNFISAVVAEDEERQKVAAHADEGDEPEDFGDDDWDAPASMSRSQQRYRHSNTRANRQRYLESVAPRLEILQNMPFMIPFETRVQIFRQFVHQDQVNRRGPNPDPGMWRLAMTMSGNAGEGNLNLYHADIRRKHEFKDAFDQFYKLGERLKEPIQITFRDEFGLVEAGIDGGGVTKEFLTSVTSQAFDPGVGMFTENSQHLLFPNPTRMKTCRESLRLAGFQYGSEEYRQSIVKLRSEYEFLGRIIGKCLYEGILIDVNFANFFLIQWALFGKDEKYKGSINDLRDLDEELYQGLLKLKHAEEDVQDWGMYFAINDTITLDDGTTKTVEHELIPDGSNRLVTRDNRVNYIYLVARYRLSGQAEEQTHAFLRGLSTIIQTNWLNMFNQKELQTLLGGTSSSIKLSDLRANTLYGGVYQIGDDGLEHPTIQLFWQVMEELPDIDRRKVLKFVTSTPRAPLLGFRSLFPRFSIRDNGADETKLPTASTCVNLFKLPMYKTAKTLREKLLYAVNAGAGFDLS